MAAIARQPGAGETWKWLAGFLLLSLRAGNGFDVAHDGTTRTRVHVMADTAACVRRRTVTAG